MSSNEKTQQLWAVENPSLGKLERLVADRIAAGVPGAQPMMVKRTNGTFDKVTTAAITEVAGKKVVILFWDMAEDSGDVKFKQKQCGLQEFLDWQEEFERQHK